MSCLMTAVHGMYHGGIFEFNNCYGNILNISMVSKRHSHTVLVGVLIVMILVIIGLIVGIVVVKNASLDNVNDDEHSNIDNDNDNDNEIITNQVEFGPVYVEREPAFTGSENE